MPGWEALALGLLEEGLYLTVSGAICFGCPPGGLIHLAEGLVFESAEGGDVWGGVVLYLCPPQEDGADRSSIECS